MKIAMNTVMKETAAIFIFKGASKKVSIFIPFPESGRIRSTPTGKNRPVQHLSLLVMYPFPSLFKSSN